MTVRIYDSVTGTLTEIPSSELAPGYVAVIIDGIAGEVFVKAGDIKSSEKILHPPFDDETRAMFASFSQTFGGVLPRTVEEWENGFRKDEHPQREIDIWRKIEAAYRHFTDQKKVPNEAKKDYLNIIVSCFNNGCASALEVIELRRLSKARGSRPRSEGFVHALNRIRITPEAVHCRNWRHSDERLNPNSGPAAHPWADFSADPGQVVVLGH